MRIQRTIIYAAVAIAAATAGYLIGESSLLTQLELRLYDLRFPLRGAVPVTSRAPVTIVAVDDESLSRITTPLKLWHKHFARLIDTLSRAGASTVAIDFIFADISEFDRDGQQQLSASLLQAADSSMPVVLAYQVRDNGVEQPADIIRLPALAVGHTFGFVNLTTDPDDFVRRQRLFNSGKESDSSFALATVRAFEQKMKSAATAHPDDEVLINYRGPVAFPKVSFARVLDAAEKKDDAFLKSEFQGRIVLVARVGAEGEEDLHSTAMYYWPSTPGVTRRTPGVDIHGNAIATVLENRAIHTVRPSRLFAIAVLMAIAITTICAFFSPAGATLISLGALIMFAYVALSLTFMQDTWLPFVPPAAAGVLAFGFTETLNYFLEGREKRYLRSIFKSYVNDAVIERIVRDPAMLSLAGERHNVAVLFADIKDFTTWSEGEKPEVVVQCLNVYFSAMVDAIQAHQGMVDKFMGDGIMAVFGAPLKDDHAAVHAVEAARAMRHALSEVNAELKGKMHKDIEIGIGINSGEAVIGHVGSAKKREYTAIGDAVNTAARIESLTRKTGAGILISQSTFQALDGSAEAEFVGEFELKGKTVLVPVYRVTS